MLVVVAEILFMLVCGVISYKLVTVYIARRHRKAEAIKLQERQRRMAAQMARRKLPSKPGITIIPATPPPKDPTSHFG